MSLVWFSLSKRGARSCTTCMRVRQPYSARSLTTGRLRTSSGIIDQLRHHVAQLVDLPLSRDMTRDTARILNVLLAVEHLPDALRLRPHRIPHVHGEDEGAMTRVVVEDRLGRRVGENSAVPIELAIDAYGRKGRRQCA